MGESKRVPLEEGGHWDPTEYNRRKREGKPADETAAERAARMAQLDETVRAKQAEEAGKLARIAEELQDPARQAKAEAAVERNLSDIEVVRARFDLVRKKAEARRQAQALLETDKTAERALRKKRAESREAHQKIKTSKDAVTEDDLNKWQAAGYISSKTATSLIESKKLLAEIQSFAKENQDDAVGVLNQASSAVTAAESGLVAQLDEAVAEAHAAYDAELLVSREGGRAEWKNPALFDAIMEETGEMNAEADARRAREEHERARLAEQKEALAKQEAESALRRVESEIKDAMKKLDAFMGTQPNEPGVIDRVCALVREFEGKSNAERELGARMMAIRKEVVGRALELDEQKQDVPRPGAVNPFARGGIIFDKLRTNLEALRGNTFKALLEKAGKIDALRLALERAQACHRLFGKKARDNEPPTFIRAVFENSEARAWVRGEVEKMKQVEAERAAQPPRPERRPEPRREPRPQRREPPPVPEKPPGARSQGDMNIRDFRRKMAARGARVKDEGGEE